GWQLSRSDGHSGPGRIGDQRRWRSCHSRTHRGRRYRSPRSPHWRPFNLSLMIVATWNVNSILVRMPNVMRWLDDVKPDVLCMQETKITDDKFPVLDFKARGYQCQLFG